MPPPQCRVNRLECADVETLWESHQQALIAESSGKTPVRIESQQELLKSIDDYQAAVRDFHVQRGVFVPMTQAELAEAELAEAELAEAELAEAELAEAEQAEAAQQSERPRSTTTDPGVAQVLQEIDKLQQGKRKWTTAVIILAVSLLLFFSLGSTVWSWQFVLLLLPILFFHELGHFVTMRIFKYRNVRMFFIPLFGAAVTGRNYNVAGWKKVIVSLMGPLPGIAVGVVLGIAGILVQQSMLIQAALLMLVLNGFNLLPILPLDGGWVAHTLLFSRHYLLDIAFRCLAAVALLAVGQLSGDWMLFGLGIFMAVSLGWAYRLARIAHELQQENLPASADDQTLPAETADAIIQRLRAGKRARLNAKQTAQFTLQVFESLNARPPGWLATLFFGGVHLVSLLVAVVFSAVFVVAMHADLGELALNAAAAPTRTLDSGAILTWRGSDAAATDQGEANIVVGNLATREEAQALWDELTQDLPAEASSTLLGSTILIVLAASDDDAREHWLSTLESAGAEPFVDNKQFRGVFRLSCLAPSAETATQIENECAVCLNAEPRGLIPPWSTKLTITPEQRLARQTFMQIQQSDVPAQDDPKIQELLQRQGRAQRRGDLDEVTALQQELQRLINKKRQEQLNALRRQAPGDVDVEMIDIYQSRPKSPEWDDAAEPVDNQQFDAYLQELEAWNNKLAERMGRLPETGDPLRDVWWETAEGGYVSCNGPLVSLEEMTFQRIDFAVPAVARWLTGLGCTDLKYELSAGWGSEPLE